MFLKNNTPINIEREIVANTNSEIITDDLNLLKDCNYFNIFFK